MGKARRVGQDPGQCLQGLKDRPVIRRVHDRRSRVGHIRPRIDGTAPVEFGEIRQHSHANAC